MKHYNTRVNLKVTNKQFEKWFKPGQDLNALFVNEGPKRILPQSKNPIPLSSYGSWHPIQAFNTWDFNHDRKFLKARLPFHSDKQIKDFIRKFNGSQIPKDQCDIHKVLDDRELITAVQATHETLGEIVMVVSQARSVRNEKNAVRDFDYSHLAGHESYGWSKLKNKNSLLKEYGF